MGRDIARTVSASPSVCSTGYGLRQATGGAPRSATSYLVSGTASRDGAGGSRPTERGLGVILGFRKEGAGCHARASARVTRGDGSSVSTGGILGTAVRVGTPTEPLATSMRR